MRTLIALIFALTASVVHSDTQSVFLQDGAGQRIQVATLELGADGTYSVDMHAPAFSDHFLSMRPFKCLEGPRKNWCHVPYPYEIERNISDDLTDLEYDFLFVWKGSSDYGINMWNGVYYKLAQKDGQISGELHEMDMNILAVPPAAGDMRPVAAKHLHPSDPESHWLPRLVIE